MNKRILKIILGLLIFRFVLAFIVWHPDLNNHADWGIRFFEYGTQKFYSANVWSFTWPNQPPGTIYIFSLMRKLFLWTFNFFWFLNVKIPLFPSLVITFFEKALYPFFLQLPGILADFGIAYLIYKLIADFTNIKNKKKKAIFAATLFLANPIVWYNSSFWGQYDSVINFFAILSLFLLLKRKLVFAVLVFFLSIYIKASLLIFAPPLLILAIKQKYQKKDYLVSAIVSFLVIGLLTFPFSKGEPFSFLYFLYKDKVFKEQLQVITANAFNLWAGLTGIHEKPQSLLLGPLSYKAWGTILYALSYIAPLYIIFKKQSLKNIAWSLTIISFSTFMLLTNMHERYLYPLFAPLTILLALGAIRPFVYWATSILSLINLYNFWFKPEIGILINFLSFGDRVMPRILGFANFGFFVHLYRKFLIDLNKIKKTNYFRQGKVTEEENKKYYLEEEDYDWVEAADNFIGLESLFHRLRRKVILSAISKYKKQGPFLDAGCGTGLVLKHLPKDSIGVDINPRNIKKVRKNAPKKKVLKGDLEKLPFKNEFFPNAVCADVIEHFISPKKTISEIHRVLEKGGILIGTVPGRSPLWKLRFLSSTQPQEPFHRYFRRKEIRTLLVKSGFKIKYLKHRILAMEILFVVEK